MLAKVGVSNKVLEAYKVQVSASASRSERLALLQNLLDCSLNASVSLALLSQEASGQGECDFYIESAYGVDFPGLPMRLDKQKQLLMWELTLYARNKAISHKRLKKMHLRELHLPDVHSARLIPLVYEGVVLGGIWLFSDTQYYFSQELDLELIKPLIRYFVNDLVLNHYPILLSSEKRRDPIYDLETEAFINAREPVIICDSNLFIAACNATLENLFGVEGDDYEGKPLTSLIPEGFTGQHLNYNRYNFSPKEAMGYTCNLQITDGVVIELMVYFRRLYWRGKEHWWVDIKDTTELNHFKRMHEQDVNRFRAITEVSPIGILQTDKSWCCIYANKMWQEKTDMVANDLSGHGWMHIVPTNMIEQFLKDMTEAFENASVFTMELPYRRNDMQVWFQIKAKAYGNESDGMVLCLQEVTSQRKQHEKLVNLATKDVLTGLTNRAFFLDRLTHARQSLSRSEGFALMSIDLDEFKAINDTYGHDVGDHVLVEVGRRLSRHIRENDTVARMGGDEFMVLLVDCIDPMNIAKICESMLCTLSLPIKLDIGDLSIGASIGITVEKQNNRCVSDIDILKQADMALYEAKNTGKNQFCFYAKHLFTHLERQLQLKKELQDAVKRGEFAVHYQLQWCDDRHCFMSAEALIRWDHPERGLLYPGDFIVELEQAGLMYEVTLWVAEQAIQQAKQWIKFGILPKDGHIAINLSPCLFRNESIVHAIIERLKAHQMPTQCLVIEILESALFEDNDLAEKLMNDLYEYGIGIALDDFGTGYSSLNYITRFKFSYIKIDKSFVFSINDEKNRTIVETIILLTEKLGLTVIAEGVASADAFKVLQKMGCQRFQGFYLHRPESPENVSKETLEGEFFCA